MATTQGWRKAYGSIKDSTKISLAKVNSEFKDLDISIVKATNHIECPPKEKHVKKIFSTTTSGCPRADVSYCVHAIAKRLAKTHSWMVAVKILIVIHRTLREADPAFREELLNYSHGGHILQLSNFRDDSSPLALDCSAWVSAYALFLEEQHVCLKVLKHGIDLKNMTKTSPAIIKRNSRTYALSKEHMLVHLSALQDLLQRLLGCQPGGAASSNYLILYAVALVVKESFKIYCTISEGILHLLDMFFEMTRPDALKALEIYKRAGQQAAKLSIFYDFCKDAGLARSFQFPSLRQPPPSFLATMEEYIRESSTGGYTPDQKLKYQDTLTKHRRRETVRAEGIKDSAVSGEEACSRSLPHESDSRTNVPIQRDPFVDIGNLLDLDDMNMVNSEDGENDALALAIVPCGIDLTSSGTQQQPDSEPNLLLEWEEALIMTSNKVNVLTDNTLVAEFENINKLYDEESRRLNVSEYGFGRGTNPFDQPDPFLVSTSITQPSSLPSPSVQINFIDSSQQLPMTSYSHHSLDFQSHTGTINPFADPFMVITDRTPQLNSSLF